MISHQNKFAFVGIMRSGTVSVETTLRDKCRCHYNKHQTIAEMKKLLTDEQFELYYKWCYLRDPLQRFVSLYRWFHQWNKNPIFDYTRKLSFEDFARAFVENEERCNFLPLFRLRAVDWITINGRVVLDDIIPFGLINQTWSYVQRQIKCNAALPHTHKTRHGGRKNIHTKTTARLIENYYAEDYKLLRAMERKWK